ncbi:hypothetical protein [Leisingera sp. JC1]|uniref:hypothetical protein n=1 Tax=Leisingera sp. JC1 TaxID=1855282 RepID=UPI001131EA4C|nr:hypothetical protein [Leisingera sp. JC1]
MFPNAAPETQYFKPTHWLGSPLGDVWGLMCKRGNWAYVLPGSRISARFPNFATIAENSKAFEVLKQHYKDGLFCWKKGTRQRLAGMVVTETIQFKAEREATEFLFAGEPAAEEWKDVKSMPKCFGN